MSLTVIFGYEAIATIVSNRFTTMVHTVIKPASTGLSSAVFSVNYGIQFLCSGITIVLNTTTLYSQLKKHKKNRSEFSMLFTHIVYHTIFAFFTLIWSGSVLSQKIPQLSVWTGLLHESSLMAIGVVDLGLAIDRLISLTFPLKYNTVIKNKLVLVIVPIASVLFATFFILYGLSINKKAKEPITIVNYVSARVTKWGFILNLSTTCLNTITTMVLLVFLWKYFARLDHQTSVDRHRKAEKITRLVNTIVFYQIFVEGIFWVCPTTVKVVSEYIYRRNLTTKGGPYTISAFMVYVVVCSVLYWKKLGSEPATTGWEQHKHVKDGFVKITECWKTTLRLGHGWRCCLMLCPLKNKLKGSVNE
uniref:Serpentine receptor class gamma n=1 Tax=Steinernema glaseri TaxID=37863 RepID=A0A1I7Z064_9BILA